MFLGSLQVSGLQISYLLSQVTLPETTVPAGDPAETTYVTSLPVAANYKGKHTTNLSYILYEYTHLHWARFGSR